MNLFYYYRRGYKITSDKHPVRTAFIAAFYMEIKFRCVKFWQPLTERRAALDVSKDR